MIHLACENNFVEEPFQPNQVDQLDIDTSIRKSLSKNVCYHLLSKIVLERDEMIIDKKINKMEADINVLHESINEATVGDLNDALIVIEKSNRVLNKKISALLLDYRERDYKYTICDETIFSSSFYHSSYKYITGKDN